MKHQAAMAAIAIGLLAACGGVQTVEPASEIVAEAPNAERAPSDTLPAIAEDIQTAEPVIIEINTDEITAAATIDGEIGAFSPALGERIKSGVEMAFQKAEIIAGEDAGHEFFMPHDYQYDYIKSASVGDLISVEYMEMVYTGGAHPNYIVGGILHDRALGEDIAARDLLSDDGKAGIEALLKEELAKQKLKRLSMQPGDLPVVLQDVEDVFPREIEYWFGEVTLVPAKEKADKFGGLVVHFSPYDVGAYAEGSYDILVAASDLEGMLIEPYADMFGGEPDYDQLEEF